MLAVCTDETYMNHYKRGGYYSYGRAEMNAFNSFH